MKGIVCKVCRFIPINEIRPEKCPACGAPKTSFEEQDEAIITPKDMNNLSELEQKHIADITIAKVCSLTLEGCQDVYIKIGQIQHPMQPEHFIQRIDFYIDKEFIARGVFTPNKLNPAIAIHLKAKAGKFTAIALCNLHGAWIKEVDL